MVARKGMTMNRPKHVHIETDRHGKTRLYFKLKGGRRIPMPPLDDPAFCERYQAALDGKIKPAESKRREPRRNAGPTPETLRWLCVRYFESDDFAALAPRTRHVRRMVIEHCLVEPIEPGSATTFADFPLDRLTSKAIKVLRDRKRGLPEAANVRVKAFRQLFAWAIEAEVSNKLAYNPARDVAYKPNFSTGFRSWSIEDVEQFERTHPVGTTARLALALLLYTGQRRSDVVILGRQHVRDGWLRFTQVKNRRRRPVKMEIPIIPELQAIIDSSPTGDMAFLATAFGVPFTANGFGNRMRKWCDEAGLPDCSAHGLRKASAARLAELGCSDREIMAITGHATTKEIDRYTKGARQRKLAENVLIRIEERGGTRRNG